MVLTQIDVLSNLIFHLSFRRFSIQMFYTRWLCYCHVPTFCDSLDRLDTLLRSIFYRLCSMAIVAATPSCFICILFFLPQIRNLPDLRPVVASCRLSDDAKEHPRKVSERKGESPTSLSCDKTLYCFESFSCVSCPNLHIEVCISLTSMAAFKLSCPLMDQL